MKLIAKDGKGKWYIAKKRYIFSSFFLSRDACIKLGIWSRDFPRVCVTNQSFTTQGAKEICNSCNLIAPSNSRLPQIPDAVPFESIVCDYFHSKRWYHFVAADRLLGWTEQKRIKLSTNKSSSKGLCKVFRRIFAILMFQLKYLQIVVQSFLQKLPKIL